MPDLLLELRSEEIPARMQRKAAGDLRRMITDGLVDAGLTYEGCQEYWTPRRLTLDVRGLTARSRDVAEEIKGPPVKAPEQAVQGFLRKAGFTDAAQAEIVADPKKGDFYVARITRPGRPAEAVIAELVPRVIRAFPWPKSMRWGAASGPKGVRYGKGEGMGGEALRWVRPLQSILCTFGPETEEPLVVDFAVDGIRSGNLTYGHRFHAPGAITVRRFDDYVAKLEAAKVVLDAERRKAIIAADARNLAFAQGLDLVEDEGLLEEVSGLVEWPTVLMGEFEADFLAIPPEVIRLTIRANQKCFVTRPGASHPSSGPSGHLLPHEEKGVSGVTAGDPSPLVDEGGSARSDETGEGSALAPRFILTANIEATDGSAEIARGNGKVVRARLSDALYFWKTDQADVPDLDRLKGSAEELGLDLSKPLDQRMARLDHLGVTFHAKLGTQGERVRRIARLAEELAPVVTRSLTSPLWGGRAEGAGGGVSANQPPPLAPPHKGERDLAALARRAAVLAKADLQTEVVGEFPELQGVMGRKYAALQGEPPSVAAAIEDHWKPQGPSDRVPTDPVSICVALADKLDTLVGFWAIDEKPTGSKDPYALRRAALGVIRIVVENGVRLNILDAVEHLKNIWQLRFNYHSIYWVSTKRIESQIIFETTKSDSLWDCVGHPFDRPVAYAYGGNEEPSDGVHLATLYEELQKGSDFAVVDPVTLNQSLLAFFHDRLKVYLRERGARHDLIDAVLAAGTRPLSPHVGEMSAQPTERGGTPEAERAAPPSALLGISPTRGESGQSHASSPVDPSSDLASLGHLLPQGEKDERPLSPLVGEMSAQPTERGGFPPGATPIDPSSGPSGHLLPQGKKEERGSAAGASTSPLWGGRAEGAGGGLDAATPTPALRADPLHEGEGGTANDDLLSIVRRVEALGSFLDTEDGKNLLAGTKRAANILAAEEKKKTRVADAVDPALFADPAEQALFSAVNRAESEAGQAIQAEDFSAAMRALSALREPVDAFFEQVLVNVEDEAVRANRLALLSRIRTATGAVADFSRIAG